MNRSNLLIAIAAVGSIACRGDQQSSTASAVVTVPLCYQSSARASSSSLAASIADTYPSCLDSPAEAYETGAQFLWDDCASESNQGDCYYGEDLAIFASPISNGSGGPRNVQDTVAIHGYEATYAR